MAIESSAEQRWYRVPLLWLSFAVFSALLTGCVVVILLARAYADEALPVKGERLLKVPTSQVGQRATTSLDRICQ